MPSKLFPLLAAVTIGLGGIASAVAESISVKQSASTTMNSHISTTTSNENDGTKTIHHSTSTVCTNGNCTTREEKSEGDGTQTTTKTWKENGGTTNVPIGSSTIFSAQSWRDTCKQTLKEKTLFCDRVALRLERTAVRPAVFERPQKRLLKLMSRLERTGISISQ